MRNPESTGTSARVVVIGAGFAGLAAATALVEAQTEVLVLEARPTAGGRANTFRDPSTGERIDNGQHVLAACYTETLNFLRRIDATRLLHWPTGLRVPMITERGRHTTLLLPPLPAPFHLLGGALAWDVLTGADHWALLRMRGAIAGRDQIGPDETVRQWLERYRQTPQLLELLWEPLTLAALNQSIDEAAAAAFVAVTSRLLAAGAEAATLLIPAVPLDEFYVKPAAAYLRQAGAEVRTHSKARVAWAPGGVASVTSGAEVLSADAVICAVPWHALAQTLGDAPAPLAATIRHAQAMASSPIVSVNLWFADATFDELFIGLPGRTFQWAFFRKAALGAHQSYVSLVASGADHVCDLSNEAAVRHAVEELTSAMPWLRRRALQHAGVVRERRATFSLRPGGPPRPPTRTSIPGLYLAGDWIDTGLPGTIESAVMSGHAAADAARQFLLSRGHAAAR